MAGENTDTPSYAFASAVFAGGVTPDDATELDFFAIYVGTTGDVSVELKDGTSITFKNVPVGILPVQGIGINNTGTSATDMIWLRW